MTRRWVLGATALAALAVSGGASSPARAAAPLHPSVEIRVIQGLKTDGGVSIDPKLHDLPQLTRDEPFIRYNVYNQLDDKVMPLQKGTPAPYDIVNGRTLRVTLLDETVEKNETRYHVRAEIDEPGKKAYLRLLDVTASANQPFFVAGQSYQGGTLFLEMVVRSS